MNSLGSHWILTCRWISSKYVNYSLNRKELWFAYVFYRHYVVNPNTNLWAYYLHVNKEASTVKSYNYNFSVYQNHRWGLASALFLIDMALYSIGWFWARSQPAFSVKGQTVDILGFVGHIGSLSPPLNSSLVAQEQSETICKQRNRAVFQ